MVGPGPRKKTEWGPKGEKKQWGNKTNKSSFKHATCSLLDTTETKQHGGRKRERPPSKLAQDDLDIIARVHRFVRRGTIAKKAQPKEDEQQHVEIP